MRVIFLFLVTNLAILVVLAAILQVFKVTNIGFWLIFAFLFGMIGSLVSLVTCKELAKKAMKVYVIEQPTNPGEVWLVNTIQKLASATGIDMPEVAIFDSKATDVFATGMSRDNALIVISTGLLHSMSRIEMEAVLGHEVSHIANGDMVILTLIQGTVNTFSFLWVRLTVQIFNHISFVRFFAYGILGVILIISALTILEKIVVFIIGYILIRSALPILEKIVVFIIYVLLAILTVPASIILIWFSRQREFSADAGSAKLVGADKMIHALHRLQTSHSGQLPEQLGTFGINSSKNRSLTQYLFSTHPPFAKRIEALQAKFLINVTGDFK